jgi:hypothetical protein
MKIHDLLSEGTTKSPNISERTLLAYAERLALGIRHLREMKDDKSVSKAELAHLRNAVKYDIKWLSLNWPHDASQAALDVCNGKVDLFNLVWQDQPRAEKILSQSFTNRTKDGVLMHEHKTPVSDLFEAMLKSNGTIEKILEILMSMQLVWILRSEDKKLKRSGRGDAHDQIYRDAGVIVVRNPKLKKIEATL